MITRRRKQKTPVVGATGVFLLAAPDPRTSKSAWESSCHDRCRLSSSASGDRCPLPVKLFFDNGFVILLPAKAFLISAIIVIADSIIATRVAARNPVASSTAKPTAANQQSLEGRLDHRDRQRAYRWRQQQGRVTDQASFRPFSCARMAAPVYPKNLISYYR
jgi:hypothetical protein